jgi:hypothetical protein
MPGLRETESENLYRDYWREASCPAATAYRTIDRLGFPTAALSGTCNNSAARLFACSGRRSYRSVVVTVGGSWILRRHLRETASETPWHIPFELLHKVLFWPPNRYRCLFLRRLYQLGNRAFTIRVKTVYGS